MSWKNLKQASLADALMVEHEALTELDDAHELVDGSRIDVLLSDVHNKTRGEQAWPP